MEAVSTTAKAILALYFKAEDMLLDTAMKIGEKMHIADMNKRREELLSVLIANKDVRKSTLEDYMRFFRAIGGKKGKDTILANAKSHKIHYTRIAVLSTVKKDGLLLSLFTEHVEAIAKLNTKECENLRFLLNSTDMPTAEAIETATAENFKAYKQAQLEKIETSGEAEEVMQEVKESMIDYADILQSVCTKLGLDINVKSAENTEALRDAILSSFFVNSAK